MGRRAAPVKRQSVQLFIILLSVILFYTFQIQIRNTPNPFFILSVSRTLTCFFLIFTRRRHQLWKVFVLWISPWFERRFLIYLYLFLFILLCFKLWRIFCWFQWASWKLSWRWKFLNLIKFYLKYSEFIKSVLCPSGKVFKNSCLLWGFCWFVNLSGWHRPLALCSNRVKAEIGLLTTVWADCYWLVVTSYSLFLDRPKC